VRSNLPFQQEKFFVRDIGSNEYRCLLCNKGNLYGSYIGLRGHTNSKFHKKELSKHLRRAKSL
jgi:hypothetical protein